MPNGRILLGVIGRPHGVRGLVHAHSYTADPADLSSYAPLSDEAGRCWTLEWKGVGVAQLRAADGKAVSDRDAAAALTNTHLYIDRDRLPAPAPDEFYLADLIGLRAVDPDGAPLGQVATVHDYGAGPSLEISGQGAPVLVPFTQAFVPTVDLAAGQVTVVVPAETEARP